MPRRFSLARQSRPGLPPIFFGADGAQDLLSFPARDPNRVNAAPSFFSCVAACGPAATVQSSPSWSLAPVFKPNCEAAAGSIPNIPIRCYLRAALRVISCASSISTKNLRSPSRIHLRRAAIAEEPRTPEAPSPTDCSAVRASPTVKSSPSGPHHRGLHRDAVVIGRGSTLRRFHLRPKTDRVVVVPIYCYR